MLSLSIVGMLLHTIYAFQPMTMKNADVQRFIQEYSDEKTAKLHDEKIDSYTFQINDLHPAQALKNIDYIFSGYNLFYSNPMTFDQSLDPAFTGQQIFKSQYSEKKVTSDGLYKLPDGVNVMSKKGCKFNFESKIIRSKEDFQKYLSNSVGLNLASNSDVLPWAFTASTEFNQIQDMIEKRNYAFPFTQSTCTLFQVTLDTVMPDFTESFVQALQNLPLEQYEASSYVEFFENYGTHYLKSMVLGSRMGMVFALNPRRDWIDEDLENAAKFTTSNVKGVIETQSNKYCVFVALPRNQSSKSFTDLSKTASHIFMIEIGPQPQGQPSQRGWMMDTESDPLPVRQQIASILDLVQQGGGLLAELPDKEKLVKNLRTGLIDYCEYLSAQDLRYGPCTTSKDMINQQLQKRVICLNFFQNCDFTGYNQYLCGNKNPFQNIGAELPEITAGSVRFYSVTPIIIGKTAFTLDYDQALVLHSFHNDFLFLDKSESCFITQEISQRTRIKLYITEPKRCIVVLLWNYCPGYAIRYFTAVICNTFDVNDNIQANLNSVKTCEVALLDIRFPIAIPLRICLYKEYKLQGDKTCFGSEVSEQFYGQSFRSMLIEETEVLVHKQMPASITVHFEEDESSEDEGVE